MLYGSMLGLLGAAVVGTLAARYMGLSSLQDLRPDPEGSAIQKWMQPYKERIQVAALHLVAVWDLVHIQSDMIKPTSKRSACMSSSKGQLW